MITAPARKFAIGSLLSCLRQPNLHDYTLAVALALAAGAGPSLEA